MTTDAFYRLPEVEQAAQIGEWEREQGVCPTHGGAREDCADPERPWFPQRTVCYAAMERAAAEWKYAELHKVEPYHDGSFRRWSRERTDSHPYGAHDGVTIWVADVDLAPHDHFLGGRHACPECSPEQSPDEQPDDAGEEVG